MATPTYAAATPRRRYYASTRSSAQVIATLISLAFVVVGVAGCIPSLTSNSAELANTGTHSHALLFDLFQTSVLHNVVHIAFGVVGLLAVNGPRMARLFLIVGKHTKHNLTAWGFMGDMASKDNFL